MQGSFGLALVVAAIAAQFVPLALYGTFLELSAWGTGVSWLASLVAGVLGIVVSWQSVRRAANKRAQLLADAGQTLGFTWSAGVVLFVLLAVFGGGPVVDVLEATAAGARRAVPAVLALAGAAVTASGVGLSLTAGPGGAGRSPDLVDTLRFVLEFAVLVLVLSGVVLAIDLPAFGGVAGGLLLVSAVSLAVSVVRAVRGLIQESAGSASVHGGGRSVLEDKHDDPPVPATSCAP